MIKRKLSPVVERIIGKHQSIRYHYLCLLEQSQEIAYLSRFTKDKTTHERREIVKVAKTLSALGLLNITYDVNEEGHIMEFYKISELGRIYVEFVTLLNNKYMLEKGTMSIKGNKYNEKHYQEMVKLPLDIKVMRSQKAILKAALSGKISIKQKDIKNSLNLTNEEMVLIDLIERVKKELPPVPEISNMKEKILSSVSISANPYVLKEWMVAGCYNENSPVNYPLALWTKNDYLEYKKRYMRNDDGKICPETD